MWLLRTRLSCSCNCFDVQDVFGCSSSRQEWNGMVKSLAETAKQVLQSSKYRINIFSVGQGSSSGGSSWAQNTPPRSVLAILIFCKRSWSIYPHLQYKNLQSSKLFAPELSHGIW